jgi:hypothetical protein
MKILVSFTFLYFYLYIPIVPLNPSNNPDPSSTPFGLLTMSENWDNDQSTDNTGFENVYVPPIGINAAEHEHAQLWEAVVALGCSSDAFIESHH